MRTFEFKSIGLRYFNVFGPRQNPKGPYSAVIPKWINKAINNEDIEVYGEAKKKLEEIFLLFQILFKLTLELKIMTYMGSIMWHVINQSL